MAILGEMIAETYGRIVEFFMGELSNFYGRIMGDGSADGRLGPHIALRPRAGPGVQVGRGRRACSVPLSRDGGLRGVGRRARHPGRHRRSHARPTARRHDDHAGSGDAAAPHAGHGTAEQQTSSRFPGSSLVLILMAKSEISPSRRSVPAQHAGLQTD